MTEKGESWVPRHITCAKIALRLRDLVAQDAVVTSNMVHAALVAEGLGKSSVRSYMVELIALGYVKNGVLTRKAVLGRTITIHVAPRGMADDVERAVRDALAGYDGIVDIL